jgi:hypothetical protein
MGSAHWMGAVQILPFNSDSRGGNAVAGGHLNDWMASMLQRVLNVLGRHSASGSWCQWLRWGSVGLHVPRAALLSLCFFMFVFIY